MTEHYVDNKKFYAAIVEYKAQCVAAAAAGKPKPRIGNYIGECILKIANKLSMHRNFYKYPFREEMVSDGIENCIAYFDNFNPDKYTNPFAYFTQIIYYAFLRRIEREHTALYTKYRYAQETVVMDAGFDTQEQNDDTSLAEGVQANVSTQNMNDFINYFEKSQAKKKAKRAAKKTALAKELEDNA